MRHFKLSNSIMLLATVFFISSCSKESEMDMSDNLFDTNNTISNTQGLKSKTEKGKKIVIGETRLLVPGDKFVFQLIPPGTETPIPTFYYEEVTDKTYTTPNGVEVRMNSMGDLGQPAKVYFCFRQLSDHTILFYGDLVPNPADPNQYVYGEWVTTPSSGFMINYPGLYFIGLKWTQEFKMTDIMGNQSADVNEEFTVVAYEKISLAIGDYYAFKIEGIDKNTGNVESYSWFSPKLGINIRKYSYSARPGYELSQYSFVK